MIKRSTLTGYGLKWNPFLPAVPIDGLIVTPRIESFCYRVESLVLDGGFAMITGDPGTGKSATLRVLADRLTKIKELSVCVMTRPQSGVADFYREIGTYFTVPWQVTNRWQCFRGLREKWLDHIDKAFFRPVLLIDEAQEIPAAVLNELRLLSSNDFDSKNVLTVVLCGDQRLTEKFRSAELVPLGTRIRTRFTTETASRDDLVSHLEERMAKAGNANLMSKDLIRTIADHSVGNFRVMLTTCDELFTKAIEKDLPQMDEGLFLEVYQRAEGRRSNLKPTRKMEKQ
jgi:general secretion pathway protein A